MKQYYQSFDDYLNKTHKLGRSFSLLAILVMMSIPLTICIVFDIMPTFSMVFTSVIGLVAFLAPMTIVELFSFSPMLGAGGSYVAFVTGNVTNMKLPCSLMCTNALGLEAGSEESEIISTIAICISSFVTTFLIIVGVMMIQPLTPVLSSPVFEPAFANIIPALFGSLSYSMLTGGQVKGLWKAGVVPFILIGLISLLVGIPGGIEGFLIILMFPIISFIATRLHKKGKISVLHDEEIEEAV